MKRAIAFIIFVTLISCKNINQDRASIQTVDILNKSTFFQIDTLNHIPDIIRPIIAGKARNLYRVDFTGDGKLDFIYQFEPAIKVDSADFLEYWITSEISVVKKLKKFEMIEYTWFSNIDNDPEPEIISASGHEDGIDYALYDQDLVSGKDQLLFYFNPVIIENDKFYWGYPGDITSLILRNSGSNIHLKASGDHDIIRDDNTTTPSTKKLPAIFFYGHATQPEVKVENLRDIHWVTLSDLK